MDRLLMIVFNFPGEAAILGFVFLVAGFVLGWAACVMLWVRSYVRQYSWHAEYSSEPK